MHRPYRLCLGHSTCKIRFKIHVYTCMYLFSFLNKNMTLFMVYLPDLFSHLDVLLFMLVEVYMCVGCMVLVDTFSCYVVFFSLYIYVHCHCFVHLIALIIYHMFIIALSQIKNIWRCWVCLCTCDWQGIRSQPNQSKYKII